MFHHGREVDSVLLNDALRQFTDWLENLPCNPLLVAHNVSFDARIILNCCLRKQVELPANVAFADSLTLFRQVKPGLSSYKLADLVKTITGNSFCAHDAVEDVQALSSIIEVDTHFEHLTIISTQSVFRSISALANEKKNLGSFNDAIKNKILNKTNAKTISRNGLNINSIRTVVRRSGEDGLRAVLKERGIGPKSLTSLAAALANAFNNENL